MFIDQDGDGRFGRHDRSFAGALVSDGVGIVRTGEEGRFRLRLAPEGTVFLLKPSHHVPVAAETESLSLWQRPGRAVAPIPFGLRPQTESERLIVLTDPEVADRREVGFVRASLSALLAEEAPACARLVLGDLVADQPGLYAESREVLAAGGSLLLAMPGNHDFEPKAREGEDPFRSFQAIFGGERYAFQCGRMRVLT